MKIVFPELTREPIAETIISHFPDIEFLSAPDLDTAAKMVANSETDSIVSGLSYPSRDVVIACKKHVPLKSAFFSSCFVCKKGEEHLILADGGINKQPTKEQYYTIIEDTATTFTKCFKGETPKIALLSYSTKGSGGKNPDNEKFQFALEQISKNHPDWLIDGEMQLDAAVNPKVAARKTPGSKVAGEANILITPDLNSGNILYKSLEQFGGFTVAGPIIQGFAKPLADLSRGSTTEDTIYTIEIIKKLFEENK